MKDKLKYLNYTTEQLNELYNSPELRELNALEKLDKIHFIAPPLVPYEPSKPLKTLFRFSGSGLNMALERVEFWVLFIFHSVISLLYFGLGNKAVGGKPAYGWPDINVSILVVPGSLITFVLVFYINQTYSRLITQSHRIYAIGGHLGELIQLLRIHLGDHTSPHARTARLLLGRMINALHFLTYSSLPQNKAAKSNEWTFWFLENNKLFTKQQVDILRKLQGIGTGQLAYKEVILWLNKGIWAQQSKGFIENRVASLFTYKLWLVREQADGLYTFVSGPVPYAYFHLLNGILLAYLTLLSYAFVFVAEYWSIPVYFLILAGFLGLRELSNAMSNPLGSNDVDIPVFHFAWKFLSDSSLLINRSLSYSDEIEVLKPGKVEVFPAVASKVLGRNRPKANDDIHDYNFSLA